MEKKLPIIIQTIIYKIRDAEPEFLLLKRSEDRGDFWNTVNGTMEMDENVSQCREREIAEETGIKKLSNWSQELYRFNFNYKGDTMTVIVFSAQVDPSQEVVINDEHTEYGWFKFDKAIETLKFDDDKKALEVCNNMIKANQ